MILLTLAAAAIHFYLTSLGYFDTLAWVDKVIEVALIVAVLADTAVSRHRPA